MSLTRFHEILHTNLHLLINRLDMWRKVIPVLYLHVKMRYTN